jgi:manganese transport protein
MEPYDIADNHSRLGIAISFLVALALIFFISNPFTGLIYSQMILSIQLPVTIFVQVYLTSSEKVMGKYKNGKFNASLLYLIGAVVTMLNIALFISFFK